MQVCIPHHHHFSHFFFHLQVSFFFDSCAFQVCIPYHILRDTFLTFVHSSHARAQALVASATLMGQYQRTSGRALENMAPEEAAAEEEVEEEARGPGSFGVCV